MLFPLAYDRFLVLQEVSHIFHILRINLQAPHFSNYQPDFSVDGFLETVRIKVVLNSFHIIMV